VTDSRRVLLIVLEGAEHRAHFNQVLVGSAHSLIFSFDGAEGFDRFLESRPDLVLVSEAATRISGTILCRLIREHRYGHGVGVFLMSARATDEDLQARAEEAGVDGVLGLPPPPEQIAGILDAPFAFTWDPSADSDLETEAEARSAPDLVGEPLAAEAGAEVSSGSAAEQVTLHVRPPEESERPWPAAAEAEAEAPEVETTDRQAPAAVEFSKEAARRATEAERSAKEIAMVEPKEGAAPPRFDEAFESLIPAGFSATEQRPALEAPPQEELTKQADTAPERAQWRETRDELTPVEIPSPAYRPPEPAGHPTAEVPGSPAAPPVTREAAEAEAPTVVGQVAPAEEPTPVVEAETVEEIRPSTGAMHEAPTPVRSLGWRLRLVSQQCAQQPHAWSRLCHVWVRRR